MAEEIFIPKGATKKEKYIALIPQIESLVSSETDTIANLANMAAALKSVFDFFWVGFYLVQSDELVLGPFQGPVACTRIKFGKGVCGTAWKETKAIIVDDVNQFPGHIACNSLSRSEIVIPILKNDQVVAVLDVDSDQYKDFDETDEFYLTEIINMLHF